MKRKRRRPRNLEVDQEILKLIKNRIKNFQNLKKMDKVDFFKIKLDQKRHM
jgi:hypothetical protein